MRWKLSCCFLFQGESSDKQTEKKLEASANPKLKLLNLPLSPHSTALRQRQLVTAAITPSELPDRHDTTRYG